MCWSSAYSLITHPPLSYTNPVLLHSGGALCSRRGTHIARVREKDPKPPDLFTRPTAHTLHPHPFPPPPHQIDPKVHDKDFVVPIGECKIEKEGTDVTLVSYSKGVWTCLEAAKELEKSGVSCEVINIRTIRPLDR